MATRSNLKVEGAIDPGRKRGKNIFYQEFCESSGVAFLQIQKK
jgi:hypothetical protein